MSDLIDKLIAHRADRSSVIFPFEMVNGNHVEPTYQVRKHQLYEFVERITELEKENFALAANQCEGPMIGDDWGHYACKKVIELEAEVKALKEAQDKVWNAAIGSAAQWCGRQASALYRLKRENEKREAFVEAHNSILKMKRRAAELVKEKE